MHGAFVEPVGHGELGASSSSKTWNRSNQRTLLGDPGSHLGYGGGAGLSMLTLQVAMWPSGGLGPKSGDQALNEDSPAILHKIQCVPFSLDTTNH